MAKTERKRLIDKLDQLCREQVRERDGDTCQKCGKHVEGSNAHVSHVIPRSRGNALRWDLQNLKLLCFFHHINWWHKNPLEASEWFKSEYPKRWKYLDKRKNDIVQFKVSDLQELYESLSRRK